MTPGGVFSTFCGSVSYVAPEIIKNIKYIGPEIDIWSLGVILYTLVCGRLPWPETVDGSPAITNIIEGDYDKTPLMTLSAGCQNLIAQVLIPDPAKRATLQDIRQHPWVNEGCSGPPPCLVQKFPNVVEINIEILEQITRIGFDEAQTRKRILDNEQCQEVTMYNLMLHKWKYKEQGIPVRGPPNTELVDSEDMYGRPRGASMPPPMREPIPEEEIKTGSNAGRTFEKKHRHSVKSSTSYGNGEMSNLEALRQAMSNGSSTDQSGSSAESSGLSSSSSSSAGSSPIASVSSPISTHTNKRNTMDSQHYRSLAAVSEINGSSRPILNGSTSPPSPMRPRSPVTTTHNGSGHNSNGSAPTKRKSLIMTGLESAFKALTKEKDKEREKPEKPKEVKDTDTRRRSSTIVGIESTWKNLFGGDKVKQVSGVFNVDTTTTQSPQQVMEEIKRVLDIEAADVGDFKMEYKFKGYIFKCSYPSRRLKFQLEICRIKNLDLTGVKLKRVKGDLWVYKEYCQRLMAKMRL
jgi:hypothetical protein